MQDLINNNKYKVKFKIIFCFILAVVMSCSLLTVYQNSAKASWDGHSTAGVQSQDGSYNYVNSMYQYEMVINGAKGPSNVDAPWAVPPGSTVSVNIACINNYQLVGGVWLDAGCPESDRTWGPYYVSTTTARNGWVNIPAPTTMPDGRCILFRGNFVRPWLTINNTAGGSVTSSMGTGAIGYGTTTTIEARPNTGWYVSYFDQAGAAAITAPSTNQRNVTMGQGDCTVNISFAQSNYTLTCGSATGGSISGGGTKHYGDACTINATPAAGYKLKALKRSDNGAVSISGNKGTFTMPAANVTVTPTWEKIQYTVTKGTATGGTLATSHTTATLGDKVTATLTPSEGYSANKPTVSGVNAANVTGSGNSYAFSMPAQNVTVTPSFVKNVYNVIGAGDYIGGRLETSVSQAVMGDVVTIKTKPIEGWETPYLPVVKDTDGNELTVTKTGTNTYTFTMPAKHVYVSTDFTKISYNVTVTEVANGHVRADKTTAKIEEIINIESFPNNGYKLDNIDINVDDLRYKGDNIENMKRYDFTMPAHNVTITPSYVPIDYNIKTNIKGNGQVTAPETAVMGEKITVTATPEEGYQLKSFTTDPEVTATTNPDGSYTLDMPATDLDINAEFEPKTYNIALEVLGKGSATVPDSGVYTYDINVGTTPEKGYQVKSITIDPDTPVKTNTENSEYSFTMPRSDISVLAEFVPIPYGVTKLPVEEGGSFSVYEKDDDDEINKIGDKIVIEPMPDPGYQVLEVNAEPNVTLTEEDDGTYSFDMPDNDVEVEVIYEKMSYKIRAFSMGHGAISTTPIDNQIYTDKVDVELTPDYGYEISDFYTDPVLPISENSFVMPADEVDVTGNFVKSQFNVITEVDGNGKINLSDEKPYYEDIVKVGLEPEIGYKPVTLKIMPEVEYEKTAENEYEFVMPGEDVTIEAAFDVDLFNINVEPNDNGEIQGPRQAKYLSEVIFKPAPNKGYHVEKVEVSPDVEVTALEDGTYTFIMPPNDVTISAQYTKNKYNIIIDDTPNGKLLTDAAQMDYDERVDIYTEPDANFVLKENSISINNNNIKLLKDENGRYYFMMPAEDAYITGDFIALSVPPADTSTFKAEVIYETHDPEMINETIEIPEEEKEPEPEETPQVTDSLVIPMAEALNMTPEEVQRNLDDGKVPLSVGSRDSEEYWALLNLILTIFTIIIAIILVIKYVQKNKENEKNNYNENNNENNNKKMDEKEFDKCHIMSIVSALIAVTSALIFALTENIFINNIMLTDKYTWLMAGIFFVQLIIGYMVNKKYDKEDNDKNENNNDTEIKVEVV